MTNLARLRLPLLALVLGLLLVATGCSQARCAWDDVKAQAQETYCPDPCGDVWAEPVYEPCCGGAAPDVGGDRGAFSVPRTKPWGT